MRILSDRMAEQGSRQDRGSHVTELESCLAGLAVAAWRDYRLWGRFFELFHGAMRWIQFPERQWPRGGEATIMPDNNRGCVVWLTGLPASGKSTLARALAAKLHVRGRSEVLDGDDIRAHLSRELGFSRADRETQVLRIAFVAQLLARNDVFVAVAAISPFREARDRARAMIGRMLEVYVATPLDECVRRDPKGLYARAIAGDLRDFTGIGQPYEPPLEPDVILDTSTMATDECISRIMTKLHTLGYLCVGRHWDNGAPVRGRGQSRTIRST